ncbi:PREDICTED: probable [Prunus dulcis]|uniref:non-specific serine/threonine protein kinase n=1 Tax=Prunus dulcis TaxID=3755 RepID=A0A5E4FPH5_PRUDU|nr:PREDICTED: probable [Prunus dulcis]
MVRILNVPMDMIFLFSQINIVLIVLMCNIGPISSTAQPQNMTLPHDEVEALIEIAAQLHKKDWNFSDPCSNVPTFSTPHTDQYYNTLFCNCSFPGNVCHVQSIFLVGQELDGVLPPALVKLPYIKQLNLGQNYLSGSIPSKWTSTKLEFLVLSVNNLSGPIPSYLGNIVTLQALALESNLFSGTIPPELGKLINMERFLAIANPCSKEQYSVHINCGGKQATIGSIKYDGDEASGGGAKFFYDTGNWGFSSTGDFGLKNYDQEYIARNSSILNMTNSELYSTARISPLSLTYYARCLANGNYTVKLHFAEIVFRNNRSYYGVGRRIFDVYIQEKLVLKDFNIQKEAQGVDKEVIKVFKAVVNVMTLEIRFHWAGKGTTNAPKRGIYGSLISAISVESDFKPPDDSKKKIFIVVGAVSVLCLIFMTIGILWLRCCFGGRASTREQDLRGLDLQTGFFRFKQIKAATNNFDAANKLGEGGFGAVYKGELLDGTIIAVKQLSSKSKQGNREFVNEIGMISALQHPNLVKLYGCPEEGLKKLDWRTRQKICVGIARGLAYLHEESALKIVHRDIKTTNILLDEDLNPKISDFGLAKLDEEEKTHISTRVAGTIGYMAPEYALWGYLTDKADVYSFGVVALELLSGKNNIKYRPNENFVCLLDWALVLQQKGNLMELVDPKLGSQFKKEEAMRMIKVALLCANPSPALRPTMSAVVSMLEGQTIVHEVKINPSIYGDELGLKAFTEDSDIDHSSYDETRSLIYSSNEKFAASTSSSV